MTLLSSSSHCLKLNKLNYFNSKTLYLRTASCKYCILLCTKVNFYEFLCNKFFLLKKGNVASIFTKGSKLQAVNYRPVSLTCITCQLFEHIICKHILAHLEDHKIFTDLQHGFRSGRSCETLLVTTFQDLAHMHKKKGSQIDIAVLDFSKAFDTVPHDGLPSKLKHYGIDEKIWLWIYNFL